MTVSALQRRIRLALAKWGIGGERGPGTLYPEAEILILSSIVSDEATKDEILNLMGEYRKGIGVAYDASARASDEVIADEIVELAEEFRPL